MNCVIFILFPVTFLCGVVVAFSVLEKHENLDSNLEDYIEYHQRASYLSALESLNLEEKEKHWQLPLYRVARDAEKDQCCQTEKKNITSRALMAFLDCVKETITDDEQSVNDQNQTSRFTCVAQCIAKKYEVVDSEGYLLQDKILDLNKNAIDSNAVFSEKEDFFKRCTAFGNKFAKDRGMVTYGEQICNKATLFFVGCMKSLSEINCPEDKQVKTQECDDRREKTKKYIEILNI